MYLVREIFNCKPGKVRPMVDKFIAMGKAGREGWHAPHADHDRSLC